MAATTTVMNTVQSKLSPLRSKLPLAALILSAVLLLASAHVFVVSLALHFASHQQASNAQPDNSWLDFAELISFSNPEVFAARARFLRQKALLPNFESDRDALLSQALLNWAKAAKIRPLWPYYPLSELNLLVLLDADASTVREKVYQLIQLAPNERGVDQHLLELAFHSWEKLSAEQQQWMLERLKIVPNKTRKYVFAIAKNLNEQVVICTTLPYKLVKRLCKAKQ